LHAHPAKLGISANVKSKPLLTCSKHGKITNYSCLGFTFMIIFVIFSFLNPKLKIHMMNIILFGPPGSGKGTQSAMIAEKFNLAHISTGDIFRYEIKNQTPLGIKVKTIIEKGELVPDELLIDLLRNAMDKIKDRNGFIFDGFPRTIPQAKDLDILMTEMKSNISGVVALEVDEEEIVGRLLKRAQLEGRSDDTEDVIRNRMSVYREQTEPLLDYYSGKGIVNKVNGVGSIDDIFLTLCDVIEKL